MKRLVLALPLLLCACDSAFRVTGVAPQAGCVVKAIDEETLSVFEEFSVSGAFTETVIVGGIWLPEFTVQAECAGHVVKVVHDVEPDIENYRHPVDLGNLEP